LSSFAGIPTARLTQLEGDRDAIMKMYPDHAGRFASRRRRTMSAKAK
jgi:hypothetical protein